MLINLICFHIIISLAYLSYILQLSLSSKFDIEYSNTLAIFAINLIFFVKRKMTIINKRNFFITLIFKGLYLERILKIYFYILKSEEKMITT